jgi:hypothetical protein
VTVILDNHIVLDQGKAVINAVLADNGSGIDHGVMQNDCTGSDCSVWRNICSSGNNRRRDAAVFSSWLNKRILGSADLI